MSHARTKSIPLPCALLALSVAVCLGAAGPVEASALRSASTSQAEQRETFESLLEAIQLAAKKLTDRLDGQAASLSTQLVTCIESTPSFSTTATGDDVPVVSILREALLNLPPPAC